MKETATKTSAVPNQKKKKNYTKREAMRKKAKTYLVFVKRFNKLIIRSDN